MSETKKDASDPTQPAVGDTVMVARIGEPEFALRVTRVVGSKGEVGAPPDAHWVELSDKSAWWVILRRQTFDSSSGRSAIWSGSKRITSHTDP